MIELPVSDLIVALIFCAVVGYLLGLWLGERTPTRACYPLSWRARLKLFFWRWI